MASEPRIRISSLLSMTIFLCSLNFIRCHADTPITKVHLIFMNHLDVGYFDGTDGDVGFISQVLNRYFVEYFPRAINLAAELQKDGYKEKFIYTTQPWLVSLYLDCPNITLLGIPLKCPTPSDQEIFRSAVRDGIIAWHAGPMNMQPENMGQILFEQALAISQNLDKTFGINRTHATYSQRDVPGMTQGVLDPLKQAGIKAISVGVNPSSAPPEVPCPFVWVKEPVLKSAGEDSNDDDDGIMAFWIKGGYPVNPGPDPADPGGLARKNCIIAANLSEALCFSFRTDNTGPPTSVEELLSSYEILRTEFPDATVFASTFDNFVQALETVKSQLPRVAYEIGDTWIQGVASDPKKMAMYRAFEREFENCLSEGNCDLSDIRIQHMVRFLIKPPEHTWGAHNFLDSISWSNTALYAARKTKNFTNTENTWKEQRQFIDFAFDALQNHPLTMNVTKAFNELMAVKPDLTGYDPVNVQSPFTCSDGTILQFNLSGSLSRLYDPYHKIEWATPEFPLGQLTYDTYVEEDFIKMAQQYNYYGGAGFDKPNVTKYGQPEKKQWPIEVIFAYQKGDSSCDFYLALKALDIQTKVKYGAPDVFYLHYVLNPALPGIDVDVWMMDKTTTRLPESISINFKPVQKDNSKLLLDKMSYAVMPSFVIANGSQYVHGVNPGVRYFMNSTSNEYLQILSKDVPVVLLGQDNHPPSPFPVPLEPISSSLATSVSFNMYNNIWNTNYIAWYPYVPEDADYKARFQIKFGTSSSS